jgi:hypothetical protein
VDLEECREYVRRNPFVKHYRAEKIENARQSDEGQQQQDATEEDNWEPTEDDEWHPVDSGDIMQYKSYVEKTVLQLRNISG